jgi:hypothetical protein
LQQKFLRGLCEQNDLPELTIKRGPQALFSGTKFAKRMATVFVTYSPEGIRG